MGKTNKKRNEVPQKPPVGVGFLPDNPPPKNASLRGGGHQTLQLREMKLKAEKATLQQS